MEGVPAGAGLDWVCVPGLHTALAVHLAKMRLRRLYAVV
jgi:hypothetical protein